MNNKSKLITICILPIMWYLYFLFELLTGRINSNLYIIFNIIIGLLLSFIGYIIYKIGTKYIAGFSSKKLSILFIVLLSLDQLTKLIIKIFFFNDTFSMLDNFLSFYPIINTQGSWLNVRFGTKLNFSVLIALNIVAIFIFIECYRYYKHKGFKDSWADMCFVFIMNGCICSLIDKIFYGGSLDFIGIGNLFIADFKDIYINLGIFLFILTMYFNGFLSDDSKSTVKEDIKSIKNFLIFIKNDTLNIFKNNN